MTFIPQAIRVGSKWVKFADITQEQLIGFVQERALNDLMKGEPFGDMIRAAVETTILWTKRIGPSKEGKKS